MLGKLTFRNVKRQISSYIIYFITVVFTVALMFAVNNILLSKDLAEILRRGAEDLSGILSWFIIVVTLIAGFIICYATVFLLRKRNKELGTYLLLGIRRSAVMKLFIIENLIIGAVSFVMGCVLGLGVFQVLNTVVTSVMRSMGGSFGPLKYADNSIWLTLGQWAGILLVAIAYLSIVLSRAKIGELVKERTTGKFSLKNPAVRKVLLVVSLAVFAAAVICEVFVFLEAVNYWQKEIQTFDSNTAMVLSPLCVAVAMAALFVMPKTPLLEKIIAVSMLALIAGLFTFAVIYMADFVDFWETGNRGGDGVIDYMLAMVLISGGIIALLSAIFLFHFTSRSFYSGNLNKEKKLKGSNVFHYRQMTGALSSNASIMGIIALLLTVAFAFSNISYSFTYTNVESVKQDMPFDVIGSWYYPTKSDYKGWPADVKKKAKEYSDVTYEYEFDMYEAVNPENEWNYYFGRAMRLSIIKESDLNAISKESNQSFHIADNEYYFFCDSYYFNSDYYEVPADGYKINVLGRELTQKGDINGLSSYALNVGNFIAVSDSFLTAQECENNLQWTILFMNTKGYMPPEFYYAFAVFEGQIIYDSEGNVTVTSGYWHSNVKSRWMEIDWALGQSAIGLVSVLYLGAAFMFFAMAILSIKVMSGADLDKKRYAILNMLGVSAERQRRILFRQIFTFCVTPMLIPFLAAIPSAIMSAFLAWGFLGYVPAAIYWIGVAIPLIYAGIYFCYFGATYYLSVKNSIKPIEKPRVKLLGNGE